MNTPAIHELYFYDGDISIEDDIATEFGVASTNLCVNVSRMQSWYVVKTTGN